MVADAALDVLLVEDSPTDVLLTQESLSSSPQFRLRICSRLGEALNMLSASHFDVILLDLGLPDSQGMETLRELRRTNPIIAVIVLTGKDDEEHALKALQEGAQDYLVKGQVDGGQLRRAIRYALERCASERKLRETEQQFRELTEHLHQVLWIIDVEESKIVFVSLGYEKLWGRSCQSLIDNPRSYMDGIHPLDLERMQRENAVMYQTGYIDVETRVMRPDGTVRWVWIRGYPVVGNGRMARVVGVIEDITEKRRLAEERDALLSRLQLHIERMPLGYVLFDSDLRVCAWNPAAEKIFGYSREEASGLSAFALVPSTFREQGEEIVQRIQNGDMNAHSVNENLTKSGRKITCEWLNTPLFDEKGQFAGILSLAADVTERRSLEDQLRQSQKMEAVGILAGGVAHDFNNLLTIINGYSELIAGQLPDDSPIKELVSEIGQAGERAATLTRQLLAFSRKQILEPRILNLNSVVTDTAKMLRRLIGEDIELNSVLEPSLNPIKADPGQVEQVLINLAVNARDAMPNGGKLTVETSNAELDETYAKSRTDVKPGNYVLLAMTDTGCGMDRATMAHIFEPFFTTKAHGKGTGLGLATVYGIVKQSGGHVAVYSEPGNGTTFKIYLPVSQEIAAARKSHSDTAPPLRGTETILLVEDEPALRNMARHVLETYGYKILEANHGESALRVAEDHQEEIDLLLTDVVMPIMGGRPLAERMAVVRPRTKILYLSGHTHDAIVRTGVLESEMAFLQKPFTSTALARKVREVLDR